MVPRSLLIYWINFTRLRRQELSSRALDRSFDENQLNLAPPLYNSSLDTLACSVELGGRRVAIQSRVLQFLLRALVSAKQIHRCDRLQKRRH